MISLEMLLAYINVIAQNDIARNVIGLNVITQNDIAQKRLLL